MVTAPADQAEPLAPEQPALGLSGSRQTEQPGSPGLRRFSLGKLNPGVRDHCYRSKGRSRTVMSLGRRDWVSLRQARITGKEPGQAGRAMVAVWEHANTGRMAGFCVPLLAQHRPGLTNCSPSEGQADSMGDSTEPGVRRGPHRTVCPKGSQPQWPLFPCTYRTLRVPNGLIFKRRQKPGIQYDTSQFLN